MACTVLEFIPGRKLPGPEQAAKIDFGQPFILQFEKMASIGQDLKRERELRGISLKEIADSTKINLRFLRALEEDRFDMLPEQFFTRGIIRSYANYLGLEEQSVLNAYLEIQKIQKNKEPTDSDKKAEKAEWSEVAHQKKRPSWFLPLIVLVILMFVIVFYFVFWKEKAPPSITQKIQPGVQTTQEKPTPPPQAIQEEKKIERQELNLEINVKDLTWLEIYSDGEIIDSGIKNPGDRLQYRAFEEFLIHTGNAGGITYTINGQKGKSFGEQGKTRRDIQITLDNVKDFIADEKES